MDPNQAPVKEFVIEMTGAEREAAMQLLNRVNLGSFQGDTVQIVGMFSAIFNLFANAQPIAPAVVDVTPDNVTPITAAPAPPPGVATP